MRIQAAVLVGLLIAPAALAAGWADFESVFPVFPCQDGWMACYENGTRITPDPTPDDEGRMEPSDMRVQWFDLEPTAGFNPWAGLSTYEVGKKPEPAPEPAVAQTEPAPEPATPEPAPGAEPPAPEPMTAPSPAPEPVAAAPEPAPQPSGSMVRPAPAPEPAAEPAPAPETAQVRPQPEPSGSMVRPAPSPAPEPSGSMVRPAPSPAPEPVAAEPAPEPAPAPAPEPAVAEVKPAGPVTCDNLVTLEPKAMMGQLSKPEKGCLEGAFEAAAKQTEKDKISRVLIANANATDRAEWARLLERHLNEVDQSDPNMSYSYASYLAKVGRNQSAIRWADVALERKDAWTGSTYTSRVYGLYKLRAEAANTIWETSEKKLASSPTEADRKKADDARQQVKTFSREWYDYAKAAKRDTSAAEKLCISAAGTAAYCTGQGD